MNNNFKKIVFACIIVIILFNIIMNAKELTVLYAGVEKYPVFRQVDFNLYYTAGKMLSEKGGGIYNPEAFARYAGEIGMQGLRPDMINYPPIHYTLMIPITGMDYNRAWWVWLMINHILLFSSSILLILTFFGKHSRRVKIFASLISIVFSLFFAPTVDTMGLGQVNIELLFLVSLCIFLYYSLQGNKFRFLAGIPLGLSIALKVIPASVALYFLWKKDWKTLCSVIVSNIVFTFLPTAFFGLNILKDYAAVKSRYFLFVGQVQDTSTYAFWKFLMPASQSGPLFFYLASAVVFLILSIFFISGNNNNETEIPAEKMALLVAVIPLLPLFHGLITMSSILFPLPHSLPFYGKPKIPARQLMAFWRLPL